MSSAPDVLLSGPTTDERPRADSRFYLAPVGGAAWLAGIGAASLVALSLGFWLLMAAVAVAGAVALWRVGRLGLAMAAAAALALGGARYVAAQPTIDASHVAAYNGAGEIELWGQVVAEPDVGDTSTRLRVETRELRRGGHALPVSGLVLVDTGRYPAIAYGATLHLTGELLSPATLSSPSYAAYLSRQNIHSLMRYPGVTTLAGDGGNVVTRALLAVRERGRAAIRVALPEPQAALLTGILLGDDSGLPDGLRGDFRATGMTHIIAISGFNIALIIALLDRLSTPLLPRRTAAVAIMLLIAAYAALVGASASVVRAALMGIGSLIGLRLMGRPTMALAGLFVAACLMTLADPYALWDIGFQLSLAATLGLLLYAGPWLRRLQRTSTALPDRARPITRQLVGDGIVVTLAAQLLTLPILIYHFGQLSLASLPANLLVLPAQPAVMLTGGLTLLAGMVLPVAGRVVGLVAWPFLTYTVVVVEQMARWRWASVPLRLSWAGLLAVYGVIAALTLLAAQDAGRRRAWAMGLRPRVRPVVALSGVALAGLLLVAWLAQRPDGRLHVAFLDVGQGDAIFIQAPGGQQALIDGGRYPSVVLDRLGEQMPFWDRSIDLVIATHPDDDHAAGLPAVMERYDVGQLLTNGATADSDPAFAALLATAGTTVHVAQAGEVIDLGGGAQLTILQAGGALGDGNDGSVVARLAYGELSLLLPGDAEGAAETALLAGGQLAPVVVLKAGHHGANTSSGEAFLAAVRPQVIVISVGEENTYGHPAPGMLERAAAIGATVLRTDEMGTIELMSNGREIWWLAE